MRLSCVMVLKNGMPFIGKALRIALPHVDQMIITISVKADERTIKEVFSIKDPKIEIYWEDIKKMSELTGINNDNLKRAKGDWVWFLEDDELWPEEDLQKVFSHFDEDIDSISINPFQVLDATHYEKSFDKSLSKFFRREGVEWRLPWPRLSLYKNGKMLNWRKNDRTLRVPYRFFHMPLVKESSFRVEPEWAQYKYKSNTPELMPDKYIKELNKLTKGIL
ncbi:MAG TPA: glycosyltransferase [bacterium]|nr:glycosyltransferase [bacterium]